MKLSYDQEYWLKTRGGRDIGYVQEDENGLYVEMFHPEIGIERVYLPR